MFSHNMLKYALQEFGRIAGMKAINEPSHRLLLEAISADDCARLFPAAVNSTSVELSCQLLSELFAVKGLPRGAERQTRLAALTTQLARLPKSKGLQLDALLVDPCDTDSQPVLVDVATVHPSAQSYRPAELVRMREATQAFLKDPSAPLPPQLAHCPTVRTRANFKTLKYKALLHAFNLQLEAGERIGAKARFIPLIISTLGQMHGFRPIAEAMAAAYTRRLLLEGQRDDGASPVNLAPLFISNMRQRLLVASARGFARSLRAAGRVYTGNRSIMGSAQDGAPIAPQA